MADLSHQTIETNGISMHFVEAGSGPLVVLCHGFPESWYSWRHQIAALADAGYHVVAPDQRGYGQTEAPEEIDAYTVLHLMGDIVGLVHALGDESAVIVGHDWGSPVAWNSAMLRPDIFRAVVSLSVPTGERGSAPPMKTAAQVFGDRFFYQLYFQTPGVAEHELQHDVAVTVRKMLVGASGAHERSIGFSAGDAPPATSFMLDSMQDPGDDLPDWLTQEDVAFYVTEFTKAGFRGGLNWYRNIDRNWELAGAFQGKQIEQPALFVAGDRDVVPFNENSEAAMRRMVPNLRDVILLPGIGHWTQQEAADEVNEALLKFLGSL
jgi:pimeloyl-ACP methyl ester carboxylesterase|tara:strand:- start:1827 stop:2792 length:966 start_codon:yes stop_codon:yes gene_type:complete